MSDDKEEEEEEEEEEEVELDVFGFGLQKENKDLKKMLKTLVEENGLLEEDASNFDRIDREDSRIDKVEVVVEEEEEEDDEGLPVYS